VSLGSTSATQTADVFNVSGISRVISVAGGGGGVFGGSQNCQSVSLAPGENCSIFYKFTPTVAGLVTGTTSISINGYNRTFSFKGIGIAPNGPPPPGHGSVPEPATWAMMITGLGIVGASLRRRAGAAVRRDGRGANRQPGFAQKRSRRGPSSESFMKRALASLVCLCMTITVVTPAQAVTFVFSGTMSGANEVPLPIASAATGSFTAVLDDVDHSLLVDLSFSGLSSNAAAGILHCCAPTGENGPVLRQFTGFPFATSGTYSGMVFGLTNTDIANIMSGLSYINIHTLALPAGEIRGQLVLSIAGSVPEPGSWLMMIGGFALAGAAMRRHATRVAYA
jgi:hypothetical protein